MQKVQRVPRSILNLQLKYILDIKIIVLRWIDKENDIYLIAIVLLIVSMSLYTDKYGVISFRTAES